MHKSKISQEDLYRCAYIRYVNLLGIIVVRYTMMDLFAPCMSLQATLCEGGMMRMHFDLCPSQSVACRLVTEPSEISFAPSTPPIYNSYTLLEPTGQVGTLEFVSRPNNAYQRLFLATLASSSIAGLQVLVKLVPRSHSQVSSKYGCAPTAYVMEYLDPSTWQTLYPFDSTKAKVVDPKLRTALNTVTKTLESKKMLTGIFEGQACHPAERNTDIQGPGEAGESIKKGRDSEMVDS